MTVFSRFRIVNIGILLSLLVITSSLLSCTAAETKTSPNTNSANTSAKNAAEVSIPIDANGPADTVRVFYRHLKAKKIREALYLTNMRPAVEGLTETELKEFAADFAALAALVPEVVEINGEIVTGGKATVTANLPNEDGDRNELQKINLRRNGDVWVILSADEPTEERIRKEGKNYFYSLKIDTKQDEARAMLERVSKAQLAHSVQNGGLYADMKTLIGGGLLPPDITSSDSTGYNYALNLSTDKKTYFATATPAIYGKSGNLSFLLEPDPKGLSRITSKELGGKPMK